MNKLYNKKKSTIILVKNEINRTVLASEAKLRSEGKILSISSNGTNLFL